MLEAPDEMANPFDDDNDDDVFDDALPSPPDLDLSSLPPPPPPPGDNEHSRLANGGWRHSCRRVHLHLHLFVFAEVLRQLTFDEI